MRNTEEETRRNRLGIDEMMDSALERDDFETFGRLAKTYGMPRKSLSDSTVNYPQQSPNQQYRNKLLPFKGKNFSVGFLIDAKTVELNQSEITFLLMQEGYESKNQEILAELKRSIIGEEPVLNPLPEETIDLIIREAVNKLMEVKDANGKYIFLKDNHWIAVFWTVVGRNIGISDYQYSAFTKRFQDCGWDKLRIPYSQSNISNCTRSDFKGRVETWECSNTESKHINVFNQMKRVADEFDKLLSKYGLNKPQM